MGTSAELELTKEMKIWFVAATIGLLLALLLSVYTHAYSENAQREIAENVLRLHVLAHSDAPSDQALKLKVRDGILERFQPELGGSIDETRRFMEAHLDEIQAYAAGIVAAQGYSHSVQAVLGHSFFPTRFYEGIAFPAGVYEGLRLIIGEGQGANWWCVLFPPLCYIDLAQPTEGVVTFRQLLSDDTYALMTHSTQDPTIAVRFRIVEWWQELRQGRPEEPVRAYALR